LTLAGTENCEEEEGKEEESMVLAMEWDCDTAVELTGIAFLIKEYP